MSQITQAVTLALSYLTLGGDILIILWLVWLLGRKNFNSGKINRAIDWFSQQGIKFAFIIALLATLGSLFYSEVAGFEPCKLCWYQRIFMYPQVLLWGIAWWKKDKHIADYAVSLAL
ncbi:MAG: disulfide bond formation protein B, partial [Patescibacteria group bacterium]